MQVKWIGQSARRTNGWYLWLCLCCSALSVGALASMGQGEQSRAVTQGMAALSGWVLACAAAKIDYHILVRLWPLFGVGLWGLVLPTLFLHNVTLGPVTIGYDVGGTGNYSWYRLGAFSFQPGELAKIAFLLSYAAHLKRAGKRLNRPLTLAGLLVHLLLPVAVIHLQGDDGTALVFAAMGCTMLFGAGLSWLYLLGGAAAGLVGAAVLFSTAGERLLKSYQLARVLALFHPDDPAYAAYTYQQNKGVLAAGSGQLWGRGLFAEYHTYIPYAWNDFIFAYLGECLGFVGCGAILLLLFGLMTLTLRTAHRAEDTEGAALCLGVFGLLLFQTAVNVGMNLQLLPVVGITLPFFSAGGTSTWTMYLAAGLVLSVYRHRSRDWFAE